MLSRRYARELVHQLDRAGERERLARTLATIPVFATLYRDETRDEVLMLWARLGEQYPLEDCISAALEEWRCQGRLAADELDVIEKYVDILCTTGALEPALVHAEVWEMMATTQENHAGKTEALLRQGLLLQQRGYIDKAEMVLERAREIAGLFDDRRSIGTAMTTIGHLHYYRGSFDDALVCYHQALTIAEEINDGRSIANAFNSIGLIARDRSRFDEALGWFHRALLLAEQTGNWLSIGTVTLNIGLVYRDQGDFDNALTSFQRALEIIEKMGDRRNVGVILGSIGRTHACRGEHESALGFLLHTLDLHRSLDFRRGMNVCLPSVVEVLLEVVDGERAAPCWLGPLLPEAVPSWPAGAVAVARAYAEEALELSTELALKGSAFDRRILLARVAIAAGEHDAAREELSAMLDLQPHDGHRAEIHFHLWRIDDDDQHRAEALRLYSEIYEVMPEYRYSTRIEKLRGAASSP